MGKPYSDLEKRALAILAGGGNPASSQDEGLAKYWKWKMNPSLSTHDLPEDSQRNAGRKLDDVGIEPFGTNMATNYSAKVTISQRSLAFFAGTKSDLGIKDLSATVLGQRLGKFKPARVYARRGAGTSSVPRTSRITGMKYKSYYKEADEGFSAPFGQKTAGDTQLDRQTVLLNKIKTSDPTINLITFSPEKIKV